MSDFILRRLQREAVADPENAEKALAYVRALIREGATPSPTRVNSKGGPIVCNHAIKLTFTHKWRWGTLPLKFTGHVEVEGVGQAIILGAEAVVVDDELLISIRRLPEGTPTPDSFVAPPAAPEAVTRCPNCRISSRRPQCVLALGHISTCQDEDGNTFGCFDNCGDPTRHIGD